MWVGFPLHYKHRAPKLPGVFQLIWWYLLLLDGVEALGYLTQTSAHRLRVFSFAPKPTKILCLDYFFLSGNLGNRYSDFQQEGVYKQQSVYKLVEAQWVCGQYITDLIIVSLV